MQSSGGIAEKDITGWLVKKRKESHKKLTAKTNILFATEIVGRTKLKSETEKQQLNFKLKILYLKFLKKEGRSVNAHVE